MFVYDQAKKLNVSVPSITFDQPLWLKAVGIVEDAQLKIVCRLGGFHTMMSFLGSIGSLMRDSGLESMFGEIYVENTISHIMAGKAVTRALRAHFLTQAALHFLLLGIVFANQSPAKEELSVQLKNMIQSKDPPEIEAFLVSPDCQEVRDSLQTLKSKLYQQSRTAKLWLLYCNYIAILKKLIAAEQTANWNPHVELT